MLRSPERLAFLQTDLVVDLCLAAFPAISVLDVGTGSGLFAKGFADRGLDVVGIDVRLEMLQVARRQVPQGRFRLAPAEAIPHRDGAFDLAFLGLVLHETDDRLQALREARRVARLGTAVLEWPYYQEEHGPPLAYRLRPDEVATLARDSGFAQIEIFSLAHLVLYRLAGGSARKDGD
jgi:ubiquinone/menaquinone biosynthesis C-methylase UbiE